MERSSSRQSTRRGARAGRPRPNASQIRVVARFRPLEPGAASCIGELSDASVRVAGLGQQFDFDRVFGPDSAQEAVFDGAARPIVEGVLAGYNGCVLAYGQTGAGKSHTMMGGLGSDRGVIPRMIEYLFAHKLADRRVRVAYLEIYNEKVRDLLNTTVPVPTDGLRVHEVMGGGGFYVKGLNRLDVATAADVYAVMRRGDRNRSTAVTNMNAQSSRSHSVFLVDVISPETQSKLVLVDLAGSEKVAKTGARGALLEEAANINRSLSALGMVVNALVDQASTQSTATNTQTTNTQTTNTQTTNTPSTGTPSTPNETSAGHVPFRDSKLTRILQDSLSGNSRTCLIVHCSPSTQHVSETVSTLRFGMRAKNVRTAPRINYTPAANDAGTIDRLQQDLLAAHRALNRTLEAERARLLAQKAGDAALVHAQTAEISRLRARIRELEARARADEHYLLTEIAQFERFN